MKVEIKKYTEDSSLWMHNNIIVEVYINGYFQSDLNSEQAAYNFVEERRREGLKVFVTNFY